MTIHPHGADRSVVFRVLSFSQSHSVPVIVVIAVVTLVMGYFALGTRVDPEVLRLLPEDAELNQLIRKHGEQVKDVDYVVLILTADDLYTPDRLRAVETATQRVTALAPILGSITPLDLATFVRVEGRLTFLPLAPGGKAPQNPDAIRAFTERIRRDPLARNMVLSADGSCFRLVFPIRVQQDYGPFLKSLDPILADLRRSFTVRFAGWIPLNEATRSFILRDPPRLIAAAVVITLLIYLVGFGTMRSVVLPLVTISVSTIWTLGIMSLAHVPLTVISIMVPPLLFALGSSYSIHVLNQYYVEVGASSGGSVAAAVTHVTGTIVLASVTTVIGFASLLVSQVARIREFGLFAGLGILFCAMLSLLLFPALLVRFRQPKPALARRVAEGLLAGLSRRLGAALPKARIVVLGVVAAIAVGFVFAARRVQYQTDFTSYYRGRVEAVEDNRFLMAKFGSFVDVNLTLTAPSGQPGYFLEPEVLRSLSAFEEEVRGNPNVSDVTSYVSYLKAMNLAGSGAYAIPEQRGPVLLFSRLLKAARGTAGQFVDSLIREDLGTVTFRIWVYNGETKWFPFEKEMKEVTGFIRSTASRMLPAEAVPELWGWNLVALRLAEILMQDQFTSLGVSVLLIFSVVAIGFRSFRYGLLAVVPLAVGVMTNYVLMWLFGIPFDVLTTMFCSIAMGVGVDDAIHLLIHYRRAWAEDPRDPRAALARTLERAGRPIILTSVAIIVGLSALGFSSFRPVAYFGLLISTALAATTAGALFVLPTALAMLPGRAGRTGRRREGRRDAGVMD